MIEIKHVSKTFNREIKAIDDVDLKLNDGEIIGFIGLNGAGKTTLIKMMTGVLKPDKGKILIDGHDIVKDAIAAKKIIGYMADNPDLFLRLTGREYIYLLSDIYEVPLEERDTRMKELCQKFQLEDVLDKPMQGYSHGTRQKMMVVGALVHNPKVWILDEPLIGLDPQSSILLKEMMREHAKNKNTVFFSTHVLEIAEKLCDKIAIIHKGKVIFYGTLDSLKKKYNKKDLEKLFVEVIEHDSLS